MDSYIKVISVLDAIEVPCFTELEVGSGSSIELRDFIEIMKATLSSSSDLHYGSINYRDDEIMNGFANDSLYKFGIKYNVEFNFRCINEGIEDIFRYEQKVLMDV